jgi:hypothetical protein
MGSLGLELVGLDFAAGHFEGCLYNEMKIWSAPSLTDQPNGCGKERDKTNMPGNSPGCFKNMVEHHNG